MSNDAQDRPSSSDRLSEYGGALPAELRVRRWGVVGLVLLTTLAVGSISLWLVVPYWVIMAWLLTPPGGWRRRPEPESVSESTANDETAEPEATPPVEPEADEPPQPARPARRRRSRAKRKAQEEPSSHHVEATWVRVGPNQFVRVDVPVETPPEESADAVETAADPAIPDPSAEAETPPSVEPPVVPEEQPAETSTEWAPADEAPPEVIEPEPSPSAIGTAEPGRRDEPYTQVLSEPVAQRFRGKVWRVRSWPPACGARVVESRRRPLVAARGLPREPGGFALQSWRNGPRSR